MPSYLAMGMRMMKKAIKFRTTSFQSFGGTAYGSSTWVSRCTSCDAHTKMNETRIMLSVGKPGRSTSTPCLSAANQMWYWQMNNSYEIRPNQAKNAEYLVRSRPLRFRSTM